jgi:hypothetical protein
MISFEKLLGDPCHRFPTKGKNRDVGGLMQNRESLFRSQAKLAEESLTFGFWYHGPRTPWWSHQRREIMLISTP